MALSILDYNKSLNQYNAKPNAITYNNALNTINNIRNQNQVKSASIGPAGSSGSGGSAPAVSASIDTSGYENSAKAQRDSMLSAIQKRLDETRFQARQQLDNAKSDRDYVVGFIDSRYPELQRRVNEQRTNANEDLDTQQQDLTTLYDRANAQARRRSESAALKNRMIARAGNRLGSSFYDETVANNQEELGRTLGESDLERIGKIAAIGTQRTRNNQQYDNTLNDLDVQKNQATYQALDEYKKSVQASEALERAGVLDFGEGVAQAEQNLNSRLDSIRQWAMGLSSMKQNLGTTYADGGAFDTGLSGIGTANQAFIANNASTPAAQSTLAYQANILGNPLQNVNKNYLAYGNQNNTLDDILRAIA